MLQTVARVVLRAVWSGALVLAVGAVHAQFNQYLYKNSVHTSLTFANEDAAHADILASGGANQLLTEKAGITSMVVDQVGQLWKAPNKDPVYTDEWVYKGGPPPGSYATEAEIVAAIYNYQAAAH